MHCKSTISTSQTRCCDYVPSPIKTIVARKLKNGQLQVKINKEKWINAEYNAATNTIRFLR